MCTYTMGVPNIYYGCKFIIMHLRICTCTCTCVICTCTSLTFRDGVSPGAGTVEVEGAAIEDLGEVCLSVTLP